MNVLGEYPVSGPTLESFDAVLHEVLARKQLVNLSNVIVVDEKFRSRSFQEYLRYCNRSGTSVFSVQSTIK